MSIKALNLYIELCRALSVEPTIKGLIATCNILTKEKQTSL